jgi:uncharacterized protein (DUF302 family)
VSSRRQPRSVTQTLERLLHLIGDKGLTVFAVIGHSGEANKSGLTMPDTTLVIFGSPAGGTPVMLEAPLAALDLPMKVLVWEDEDGEVEVSYNTPEYLAARHNLSDASRSRLEPVKTIAEATVSTSQ